ncbi:glycosyltransferase family 4 protein [Rhodobacteraceae bacterium B1Z28]|uniref:Glycosyltransferase family 4 protein n=1 Tax=Ruegeria haliotis TaxID=2747601 RepID=A0ABX2PT82_9RHOB|nr:glycosyltransferase family 4 protein [Ruegeria haliotis]NVO56387.1 glycosyltransferase family 4 protein [Ruegeria haliotis]
MKLLIVQGGFGVGGAEKIVSILAAHRVERGDEVHVAGLTIPPGGSYFEFPDTVTLHIAQSDRGQLDRLRHIRKVIQDVSPDVVVTFLTKINVLTLLATLDRQVPVIISERNNPRAQSAHPLWRHAQNLLARRAHAVVMQTHRACEDLPGAVQRKARVISNPCALPPGAREHLGVGATNLVAVGRLDRQKGFDLLLAAMPRILKGNPDAKLTIFGEGPEREALEAMRKQLKLTDVVSLPGSSPVPGAWMDGADILVFPSRYEGFPNVLAEATVTGLPVVSFDCPYGPRELIRPEENGLLVPPEDVEALAQAVLRLSQSPDLLQRMRDADLESRVWLAPDNILAEWDEAIDDAV